LQTQHNRQYVFIPETSGAVKLRIKAADEARIALTNGPHECSPMTEVKALTPNILNENEYVDFWIRWQNNEVSAGLKDNPAFIKYLDPNPHPITYFAVCTGSVGHWKIEVSPLLFRSMPVKPIEGGQLRWVQKTRETPLPEDALIVGYENGEALYLGRVLQEERGTMIPGKYVPSKQCLIILCGYNASWLQTYDGCIPPHAVPGGYESGKPLFIGRARVDDNLIPGKVHCSHQTCYLPYSNTEINMREYEILVIPDKLPDAVVWKPTALMRQAPTAEHAYRLFAARQRML
ncbi:Farnesoic acid O-methyltransferase, partial [Operophtera brumata]